MKNTVEIENRATLAIKALEKAKSYREYRELVSNHVKNGTSTGPNQTEALAKYTLLNDSRMRRLDKTTKISEIIIDKLKGFKGNQTWLVLTESWCGDAAQSMPVMNKLDEISDNIDLRVVLRDQHLDLMNAFLTNGSQSIPKVIILDTDTKQVLGEWGPRPSTATEMVHTYKRDHGSLSPEFKQDLQVWYNKDKGVTIAEDLTKLIK
ncbi:MAG: thioredoxin family protein [Flavobacteriales bacterium]|nr:thioredoxin family protein [Ulvibacter sp.]MDC1326874.1 thioredoxin family protein [Ulvibacter sp.]